MTSVRSIRALAKWAIQSCNRTLFLSTLFFGVINVGSVKADPIPFVPPNFVAEGGKTLQLAIRLETEFWTAVQARDLGQLSSILAPEFQSLGELDIGGISRIQEIRNLISSNLNSFLLSNVVATRKHSVLVISYFLTVAENRTDVISGPALSTWKKTKDGWQMVSNVFIGVGTPI